MNAKMESAVHILQTAADQAESQGVLEELFQLMCMMRSSDDGILVLEEAFTTPIRGLVFSPIQSRKLLLNGAGNINRNPENIKSIRTALNRSLNHRGFDLTVLNVFTKLGKA